jgi:hydrogenase nickel incorporation protein HypA/HybF
VHELALIESVVDAVTARVGDRRVARVRLRVGALAGVVPDAMQFCFDVATEATPLEGAVLEIESVPGLVRCAECHAEHVVGDGLPLCLCGSANVEILAGQELLIQDVEMR